MLVYGIKCCWYLPFDNQCSNHEYLLLELRLDYQLGTAQLDAQPSFGSSPTAGSRTAVVASGGVAVRLEAGLGRIWTFSWSDIRHSEFYIPCDVRKLSIIILTCGRISLGKSWIGKYFTSDPSSPSGCKLPCTALET